MKNTQYAVICNKHGKSSKAGDPKRLIVGAPKNKRDRREGGCPLCKQEEKANAES